MQGDVFGLVGATLEGRYRIDSLIGEGGFGVVYRGQHLSLQHSIAIKCLKTPQHFTPQARDAFFAKFREEGQLLSRLRDCPGIVHAYDFGVTGTRLQQPAPYLVLEWLEGQTLEAHLAQRRTYGQGLLSLQDAVALLAPVFDALAFAHRMKIAHRDIKPANLFLANTARGLAVKVLDFGIAKAMQEGDSAQQAVTGTGSGFQAFSPAYGSPEQFFSRRYGASGPWTDVHALALVLVEMLTGRPALQGEDMAELLTSATAAERPTPRNRGLWVSEPVEAVFARALATSPAQRYPDAEQFYEALRHALHATGLPIPGPLPSLASAYGPPMAAASPAQPAALPAYTPAPSPAAVGVWQQPQAAPPATALPGYGQSIPAGFTVAAPGGATELPGYPPHGSSTERPGYGLSGYGSSTERPDPAAQPHGATERPGYGSSGYGGATERPGQSGHGNSTEHTGHQRPYDGAHQGTEVAIGGSTQVPWTAPTPPAVPPVAPRSKRASKTPTGLVIGGMLLLVGGGLGVAGLGVLWYQQSGSPSGASSGARGVASAGVPPVEHVRWIEEGREVFGIGPLQETERGGRWHHRITREGTRTRRVQKIRPSGAVAEEILFEDAGAAGTTRILRNDAGVEQSRSAPQQDGTLVTTQRSGEVIDHGCSRVQLTHGPSGDTTERRCLSPTGVPIGDEEGCQVWRYTHDAQHRRTSSACFQVDEGQGVRPAENKEGIHLARFQHDATGAKVKEQFFDATGAPVARLSDGCYGLRLGYDGAGNQNAQTCLDTTGAPQARKGQQAATTRWDFDRNGCVVRQSYQDVAGVPSRKGEIAHYQVVQDARCNMLSVSLHAPSGALIRDASQGERVALLEHEYNERNDRVLTRCYDEKRKPMHCGGFPSLEGALQRFTVDERGRTTSRKHFFLDGRPSKNPGGYPHEIRMTYGEDGRLATQTFLDESGGFATALGPVGRMAMRYDAMGNLLSQTFFGVTGVPVESAIGCHEVRFAYDPRNRLSSVECRSSGGDLKIHKDWRQNGIDWPPGAARMVVERGELLVNTYSAPDGRVIKRVECKKTEQLCYRLENFPTRKVAREAGSCQDEGAWQSEGSVRCCGPAPRGLAR